MGMGRCRWCGFEVEWVLQGGLLVPVDPNFRDHRESCAGRTRFSREAIRDHNHEHQVKRFLALAARKRKRKHS